MESLDVYEFVLAYAGKGVISFGATANKLITFKRWNSSEKAFVA